MDCLGCWACGKRALIVLNNQKRQLYCFYFTDSFVATTKRDNDSVVASNMDASNDFARETDSENGPWRFAAYPARNMSRGAK